MPLHPGTTLGAYAVTAKIGEGGMGVRLRPGFGEIPVRPCQPRDLR